MLRVMLDLETLGTRSRAAVVQIGAVVFNEYGPDPERFFLRNVNFQSALQYGDVDGATLGWWMCQSDAARLGLFSNPKPVGLPEALRDFDAWWRGQLALTKELWSHATFDAVILKEAYRSVLMETPWSHRGLTTRSTRLP